MFIGAAEAEDGMLVRLSTWRYSRFWYGGYNSRTETVLLSARWSLLVHQYFLKYAALSDDAEALAKITELEQLLSKKTGKDIVLVAFSI